MNGLKNLLVATFVATLASCASTSAPYQPVAQTGDIYGPAEGESELTFGGSFGTVSTEVAGSSTDTTGFDGQVGYGQYLSNEHEVGGQLIFNLQSPDEGDDTGSISVLPYYRYNFRGADRIQYYLGVHGGLSQIDAAGDSDTGFSYGIHGGLKSWLTPQVSFFVEPRLTFSSIEISGVDIDIDEFRTLLGFTYSL